MKRYRDIGEDTIEIDIDGVITKFDLLFSFDCKENGRTYIAFTDGTFDQDGDAVVMYGSYDPSEEDALFYDVTSQMELDMIDEVFDSIQKNINGEEN